MSCVTAPKINIADIPGLSLFLGDLSITTPDVSLGLCCNFQVAPPFPIVLPLGAILGAMGPTADLLFEIINTIVDQVNLLLDLLSFDCPLD